MKMVRGIMNRVISVEHYEMLKNFCNCEGPCRGHEQTPNKNLTCPLSPMPLLLFPEQFKILSTAKVSENNKLSEPSITKIKTNVNTQGHTFQQWPRIMSSPPTFAVPLNVVLCLFNILHNSLIYIYQNSLNVGSDIFMVHCFISKHCYVIRPVKWEALYCT